MEVLLRALQPALKLPLPLAQWPLQLLYASCMVSFPTPPGRVRPRLQTTPPILCLPFALTSGSLGAPCPPRGTLVFRHMH